MENTHGIPTEKRAATRNLLWPSLALLFITAVIVVAFSLRGSAQAGGTVTLLFFDRNGTALTPTQVRSTSNNGGAGYNNDFLLNPTNMRAISTGPLYTSGSNLAFNIPSQAVALAFNWPTLPGGYQLIVLDKGGTGFTTGGVINFTYQAALDVKKKLDAARATRPDYVPSAKFNSAYQAASSQLASVDVYSPEATKGKAGQLALDQLAVAYDAILAEHGPIYAAANKSAVTPWIGFTIDAVSNYQANVDLAASLAAPYAWIRIVFDAGQAPSTYTNLVNYAKTKGVKVLGQPIDSTYDKGYTRAQYKQRFIDYITAFPQIDAWEVGNEVNGSWLSSDIGLRIADAAAEVKARAPGKPTFLTFFWQINTDSVAYSMFTWMNANLPASTRANIDVVTFSQYQEQAPMGVVFDQVMKTLRAEFPTQRIGLGELGYWIPGQQFWWAYNQTDTLAAKRAVAEQYYNASFDYPGSIGGVFWWTFITDFKTDTVMQQIVKTLRDKLQSGSPTPTPTPTPTATPSPTATPTPTPGGIVFNGYWALMAKIPSTATYQDFYQTVPVTPNANHTSSVWVRGSGSLELQVWANATWTRRLASVRVNATSTWTKFTTPVFNVGNRQRVYLSFDTAYSNAAGTMYLDEVFLGVSGGVNRVMNPSFESGTTGWSNDATTIFSMIKGF